MFFPGKPFQHNLLFASKAETYPSGAILDSAEKDGDK